MVRGRLTTAVVECGISKKAGWMSRADGMASLVTRSNCGGFPPVGTPEGPHVPSQDYPSKDLRRLR